MKKEYVVGAAATFIAIAFALGIYFYNQAETARISQLAKQNEAALNRPHAPTFGARHAKVQLVEFLDPACETCRSFYPLVKDLVNSQPGKVKLIVRYAPFHKGSDEVVRILEAARMQGIYWPVLEAVLKAQPVWADHGRPQPELVWNYLGGVGLDLEKVRSDLSDPRIKAIIEQDSADVVALKVTRTPSFFVNGKPLQDFGYEQLRKLVQDEIEATYKD